MKEQLRCKHCTVKVVPINPEYVKRTIGKGESPTYKHDLHDMESGPTCGKGALRDSDVFNDAAQATP